MPVCFALSRIDPLARWVYSDSTWERLRPLFKLAGTYGAWEYGEDVVITLILVASFFIAWVIAYGASMVLKNGEIHVSNNAFMKIDGISGNLRMTSTRMKSRS